mgnify:CR=1 FL=1
MESLYTVIISYELSCSYLLGTFQSELAALDSIRDYISSELASFKIFWQRSKNFERLKILDQLEEQFKALQNSIEEYKNFMTDKKYLIVDDKIRGSKSIDLIEHRVNEILIKRISNFDR